MRPAHVAIQDLRHDHRDRDSHAGIESIRERHHDGPRNTTRAPDDRGRPPRGKSPRRRGDPYAFASTGDPGTTATVRSATPTPCQCRVSTRPAPLEEGLTEGVPLILRPRQSLHRTRYGWALSPAMSMGPR